MFALRNLCVLTYANGHNGWHYKVGGDALADVLAQGYFNDACGMMSQGDTVTVSARDGVGLFGVSVNGQAVSLMRAVTDPAEVLAA